MKLLLLSFISVTLAIECAPGFTCFEETSNLVWIIRNVGNLYGPTCSEACSEALCSTGVYHTCDSSLIISKTNFNTIAQGLGFSCNPGECWDGISEPGVIWVSTGSPTNKNCYFPPNNSNFDCSKTIGNQNCFGERYSLVCPCKPSLLESSCKWPSPPYVPAVSTWPVNPEGTSCLERINYWRRRACEENWYECPACGLPPMVEGTDCHACANSQAEYDSIYGAHASFTRCGELVQGEGGGRTCADVIDSFIAERQVFPDSNGQVVCRGHCGPILEPGCKTFFWGKSVDNFYTLNWSPCNPNVANAYCNDPEQTAIGGICRQDSLTPTSVPPTSLTPTKTPTTLTPTSVPPTTLIPTKTPTTLIPTSVPPTTLTPTSVPPTTLTPTKTPTTLTPTKTPTTLTPTKIPTSLTQTRQPTIKENIIPTKKPNRGKGPKETKGKNFTTIG